MVMYILSNFKHLKTCDTDSSEVITVNCKQQIKSNNCTSYSNVRVYIYILRMHMNIMAKIRSAAKDPLLSHCTI